MMRDKKLHDLSNKVLETVNNCLVDFQNEKEVTHVLESIIKDLCNENYEYQTFIKTIYDLLIEYLNGKISEDVICFYLEKQYSIQKEDIKILINNMNACSYKKANKFINFGPEFDFPKVSIIITTYNRKDLLKEAIDSILSQDYPNIEIIVIDDNSKDGTSILLKDSYEDENSISYILNEINRGPGYNRRIGFNKSTGDFVLFLDDDDFLIDSNYISKAINFHMHHSNISFVAANVFYEYSKTRQYNLLKLGFNDTINKHEYFLNFEKMGYPKPASTLSTIFKREALVKADINNMNMVNDASIYLRALLVGDAGFIDTVAGVYRIHGNNITFNLSPEFLVQNLEEKLIIKDIAINKYGYDIKEMDDWFVYNADGTISYFLFNSMKSSKEFKYIYDWVKINCPKLCKKIRGKYLKKITKMQLKKIPIVKNILS